MINRSIWVLLFTTCLICLLTVKPRLVVAKLAPGVDTTDRPLAAAGACPSLPPATGVVVDVSTVAELQAAVNSALPGTTIRIADGAYFLNGVYLRIDTPNVTLRSASGSRSGVVLDGDYVTTEIIQIVASDVTIANLTLRKARYHPIHVMSTAASHTLNTLIYNVHIVDPGQQAIKINPVAGGHYADQGVIACSRIDLTAAGRQKVWQINGSCYTGGVDAHQARDWTVRDNHIEGFWCAQGLAEHAIHLWRGCRDTLVERNVLADNARGVGFGLDPNGSARTYPDDPCPGAADGYVEHYGGIIRNNSIFAGQAELLNSQYGFDCGICLWQACGAQVMHNSVASSQAPFSSIEWRYADTDVDITNNLTTHRLLERDGKPTARLRSNLDHQPLSLFVDGLGGDLHLKLSAAAAIDQGAAVPAGLCDDDMDGDNRLLGAAPDIGADEVEPFIPEHWVYLPMIGEGW